MEGQIPPTVYRTTLRTVLVPESTAQGTDTSWRMRVGDFLQDGIRRFCPRDGDDSPTEVDSGPANPNDHRWQCWFVSQALTRRCWRWGRDVHRILDTVGQLQTTSISVGPSGRILACSGKCLWALSGEIGGVCPTSALLMCRAKELTGRGLSCGVPAKLLAYNRFSRRHRATHMHESSSSRGLALASTGKVVPFARAPRRIRQASWRPCPPPTRHTTWDLRPWGLGDARSMLALASSCRRRLSSGASNVSTSVGSAGGIILWRVPQLCASRKDLTPRHPRRIATSY